MAIAGAAIPGLFFSFAACALLVIVSVSVPIWKSVYFMSASDGSDNLIFGNWGICAVNGACTASKLGYNLDLTSLGIDSERLSSVFIKNLTYVLILHPIAAGLAGLAMIFGLLGVFSTSRAATILMTIASFLALLITLTAWVVDMVLWGIARNRIRNIGGTAQYGNATWMVLGAFVALLISCCVSLCGSFGRFRSSRNEKY
ncbi:pali-domain-containing protein [Mrakia frigida]|uniref:SUR7/PalI family protein n=1 Tax=Mrakia frigida TaxID=29902 RepID=UPI003FCC0447